MNCLIDRFSFKSSLRAAGVFGLIALAGCALFKAPAPPIMASAPIVVTPVPAVMLARANATHRFVLGSGQDVVGVLQVVRVGTEDTFSDIARRFNVGYEEMVRANPGVDPWLPGVGREVVVPTRFVLPDAPREGLVINVAAMRIYYYPHHARGEPQLVITHPIGIGKVGWRTPEGVTHIVGRVKNPVWIPTASVRKEHLVDGDLLPAKVLAGPDNPLGAHMFRLGWPTYLIHGTNKPYGVGMRSSHGCIRLYPEDIALLFDSVPIGTAVRVVNQPVVYGWEAKTFYMQVYGPLQDDHRDWRHQLRMLLKKNTLSPLLGKLNAETPEIDWELSQALLDIPRGMVVAVGKVDGDSVEREIQRARHVRNALPLNATWVGDSASLGDAAQFDQLLLEREPDLGTLSPGSLLKH